MQTINVSPDFLYNDKKFICFAKKLTGNIHDAKDIIQDTAIKMLRYKELPEVKLKSVANTTIYNTFIDFLRKKKKHSWEEIDELLNYNRVTPSFENQFIAKETLKEVYIKILMLPPDRQRNLLLIAGGETTYQSLSEKNKMNKNTLQANVISDREFLKGERDKPMLKRK
jgi:RNA polymerase sigma factor (sigma-70 family)